MHMVHYDSTRCMRMQTIPEPNAGSLTVASDISRKIGPSRASLRMSASHLSYLKVHTNRIAVKACKNPQSHWLVIDLMLDKIVELGI